MARIKAQKLKPIILLFLLFYIIYGTCVVFGAELSQENGDGATQVTAKIEKESQTQPTTEENTDSANKPDENPPLPTGEKLTLGFLFLIIAAGTMVIVVTYRGNSRQKE